mmetsp:Transcript_39598/g.92615  ORF Transcript_39598/g.92615 Transcript_39598/m.92615 type:complete len:460 (-) Transcript_39598:189-1568(-)
MRIAGRRFLRPSDNVQTFPRAPEQKVGGGRQQPHRRIPRGGRRRSQILDELPELHRVVVDQALKKDPQRLQIAHQLFGLGGQPMPFRVQLASDGGVEMVRGAVFHGGDVVVEVDEFGAFFYFAETGADTGSYRCLDFFDKMREGHIELVHVDRTAFGTSASCTDVQHICNVALPPRIQKKPRAPTRPHNFIHLRKPRGNSVRILRKRPHEPSVTSPPCHLSHGSLAAAPVVDPQNKSGGVRLDHLLRTRHEHAFDPFHVDGSRGQQVHDEYAGGDEKDASLAVVVVEVVARPRSRGGIGSDVGGQKVGGHVPGSERVANRGPFGIRKVEDEYEGFLSVSASFGWRFWRRLWFCRSARTFALRDVQTRNIVPHKDTKKSDGSQSGGNYTEGGGDLIFSIDCRMGRMGRRGISTRICERSRMARSRMALRHDLAKNKFDMSGGVDGDEGIVARFVALGIDG